MFGRLDHIYITVGDLARSEAFYDELLALTGWRKVRGRGIPAYASM